MFGKLLKLFRGRSVVIQGTGKLPEGEARTVDVGDVLAGGTQVVLCRLEGRLYALDTLCPHEGGRIAPGPLWDQKHVMCPLHNYRFDPRTGVCVSATCGKARTYRVEERDGHAEIWV